MNAPTMIPYLLLVGVVAIATLLAESRRQVVVSDNGIVHKTWLAERQLSPGEISRAALRHDAFGASVLVIASRNRRSTIVIPVYSERIDRHAREGLVNVLRQAAHRGAAVDPEVFSI